METSNTNPPKVYQVETPPRKILSRSISKTFWALIAAATPLLNRLRYAQKFVLISILAAASVVMLTYFLVAEINSSVDFARKERPGIEYISALKAVMREVILHRAQAQAIHSGDSSLKDDLLKTTQRLTQALGRMDRIDQRLAVELQIPSEWFGIRRDWQRTLDSEPHATAQASFTEHTRVVNEISDLIVQAGETSNLMADPGIDSDCLTEAVVNKLPAAAENLGILLGLATRAAAQKAWDSDDRLQVAISVRLLTIDR